MIAEMSEKQNSPDPAPAGTQTQVNCEQQSNEGTTKSENEKSDANEPFTGRRQPLKKRLGKDDAPKSSFDAWKQRSLGKKKIAKASLNPRKDISVRKGLSVVGSPAREELSANPKKSSPKKSPTVSAPEVGTAAASAAVPKEGPALPTKESLTENGNKIPSSLPPKKAAVAKKEADGDAGKKTAPQKASTLAKKTNTPKKASKKGSDNAGGKSPTFPEKIMDLLQSGLATNAIYWLPEGEAIAVDPDNFKDCNIINKQFRGNKLSSFVRSLNRW